MKPLRGGIVVALLATLAMAGRAQKGEFLTEAEQDRLREAQDPAQRIQVYLDLAQARLDQCENARLKPPDPRSEHGEYLEALLDQYIALDDELKNWIDLQFQRNGDMRPGLRAVLERGPHQLEQLRRIQQTPDSYSPAYAETLQDAMDDLTDTLDGATKALAGQEKKFTEARQEEKVEARATKERTKEEKKRTKGEKKLRKRERKKGVPTDNEQN